MKLNMKYREKPTVSSIPATPIGMIKIDATKNQAPWHNHVPFGSIMARAHSILKIDPAHES
ncbi:MAG TPA: hypothetical protein VKR32_08260 [Puia sp.]|nr:hypothetical protein [Puia sp.]